MNNEQYFKALFDRSVGKLDGENGSLKEGIKKLNKVKRKFTKLEIKQANEKGLWKWN